MWPPWSNLSLWLKNDPILKLIIHLFTCGEWNSQYVGSSIRQLKCRVVEHMGLSPRLNLLISHPNFSSILEHHKLIKHALSPSNFKILSNSSNSDIRVLESIYIHKLIPINLITTHLANLILFNITSDKSLSYFRIVNILKNDSKQRVNAD